MTNLEKLIETLQNAPIERTACFIFHNANYPCKFCINKYEMISLKFGERQFCDDISKTGCIYGIRKWLESEVE